MSVSRGSWPLTREEAVDEKSVYCNDDGWQDCIESEQERDGDSFMNGIGILECIVAKRKVLVVGFDGIESVKCEEENPKYESTESTSRIHLGRPSWWTYTMIT